MNPLLAGNSSYKSMLELAIVYSISLSKSSRNGKNRMYVMYMADT